MNFRYCLIFMTIFFGYKQQSNIKTKFLFFVRNFTKYCFLLTKYCSIFKIKYVAVKAANNI